MNIAMPGRRAWRHAWVAGALLTMSGCGAKTGLLIDDVDADVDADPDVDPDVDADPDVDPDVDPDPEVDADSDLCRPDPVGIDRRRAEVLFTVDRSNSMDWSLEGDEDGWPTRWVLLRDALSETLYDFDHLLEIGAKFFPRNLTWLPEDPETSCQIDPGIDLDPAPFNTSALLGFFDATLPAGGTPTALGLAEARQHLTSTTRPGVAQFVVLATDGGPNCNAEVEFPCTCTGTADMCDPDVGGGPFNCLDEERTLDVITRTNANGIAVFVIGLDDPNREDLADFMDEMAVAGGRPRSEPGERQFYSVQREDEMRDALGQIIGSIARCLFVVDPSVAFDPRFEVRLDGEPLPRDEARVDGWDWTNAEAGELTLFGASCDRAFLPSASVTAALRCLDEPG